MADFNPLSILDEIPGVKQITDAAKALGDISGAVEKFLRLYAVEDALHAAGHLAPQAGKIGAALEGVVKPSWNWFAQYGAGTLFREYLEIGLGLNYDKLNGEAQQAIKTIDTMLTFSTAFPLVIKGVDAVLDFFLGQRAPKLAESALGHIAEEMGLTWAMGQTIDRAFETAVGNKLEEAILHQKRPVDPELQVLRLMMRQHLIDEDTFKDRAAHMGFSDKWVKLFGKLADAQVPVGDLQQLWFYDLIKASDVDAGLDALGFIKGDRDNLKTLYLDKAQTQGGLQLRSVARELAIKGIFTPEQYKNVLTATNMSPKEESADLAALHLELTWGRTNTPLSAIKLRYQHGELVDDTARPELKQLGYSEDAIAEVLDSWKLGKLPHPMSAAKVLTYWYSGVLTDPSDAFGRLVATGLREKDAHFLLDHPPAGGARKHQLTPALVMQAFVDGLIDTSALSSKLKGLGVPEDAAKYMSDIAIFRHSRAKHPAHTDLPLSRADILKAFKEGVWDPGTAQTELEKIGYSSDNALLLLELENKGANPFLKGAAPLFADLNDAIAYMESHGFDVFPPPDPSLSAAESMLAQHGYSWQDMQAAGFVGRGGSGVPPIRGGGGEPGGLVSGTINVPPPPP